MKVIAPIFLLLLAALAASDAHLLYAPHEVRLSGTIRRQTFPGPPNYEDITTGDAAETYWILDLDSPVDVVGAEEGDKLDMTERSVRSVQLVFGILGKKSYSDYPGFLGQHALVSGQLLHAISGHHRTVVLISVREMKKAPNKAPEPTPTSVTAPANERRTE